MAATGTADTPTRRHDKHASACRCASRVSKMHRLPENPLRGEEDTRRPERSHHCCASRLGEEGVRGRAGQLDHHAANQQKIPDDGTKVVQWRVLEADRDCLSRAHHPDPARGIGAVPQDVPPGNHRRRVNARQPEKSNSVFDAILIDGAGYGSFLCFSQGLQPCINRFSRQYSTSGLSRISAYEGRRGT